MTEQTKLTPQIKKTTPHVNVKIYKRSNGQSIGSAMLVKGDEIMDTVLISFENRYPMMWEVRTWYGGSFAKKNNHEPEKIKYFHQEALAKKEFDKRISNWTKFYQSIKK